MRPFQLSTDVVSIGELKIQAARLLQRVKKDRCPIVITQHGKPAGVLVSTEDFDRMSEHSRFLQAVERGLDDVKASRLIDDDAFDVAIAKPARKKVKK